MGRSAESDIWVFCQRSDPVVLKGKRKAVNPVLFDLSVNYRSHGGIINMAGSLVKLLERFFPNSIDNLAKETARVRRT